MAWQEQLPSGHWRARWRDAAGRPRSTTRNEHGEPITRRAEAKRIGAEMEGRTRRGGTVTTGRAPTWGEWCPTWLAARRVEPSTAAVDALRLARYLEPQWAGRRLPGISRTDVQAWVNTLAATDLAPASVEKVFRLFSSSMTEAVRDERIPVTVNPCTGVKLPTVAPGHERFLTRGEVDAVAYYLNQPYRLAVLLAAGTGLRWGELAGLHWQRVDLGAGVIDIVETWDPTAGRVKSYPKGRKRRAVPIPPWLAVELGAAYDKQADITQPCGQPHAAGGARCRSPLVVTGPNGAPLNGRNFGRRQWANACALAGITDTPRLHDLRHSYASWLVQNGVELQEVQRLLGHSSILTTQRYAHLGTSQNDRVLAALS